MKWFLKRLSEPSTQAGLGVAAVGAGQLAGVLQDAGTTFAATGSWQAGVAAIVFGLAGMFLSEKGQP